MSHTWVKGPVCGTENCPSRLYRTVDGRRICQYGHVKADDIEINDEEDGEYVMTKRLNIPSQLTQRSQAKQKDEVLFGVQGRVLYLKVFQQIVRSQTETVVEAFNLDRAEVMGKVRLNVLKYLQWNNLGNGPKIDFSKLPRVSYAVSIIYLACFELQLPVYMSDIYDMVVRNKISYMNPLTAISEETRKILPSFYSRAAQATRIPDIGDLYADTLKLNRRFNVGVELNYHCYLHRLIQALVLPLDVFRIVERLISILQIDLRIETGLSLYNHPELKIASLTVTGAELFFFENQELLIKWVNIQMQKPDDRFDTDIDLDDIPSWSGDKIDDYLSLMSAFVLEDSHQAKDVAKRRVFDIFDPKIKSRSTSGTNFYNHYKTQSSSSPNTASVDVQALLLDKMGKSIGVTTSQLMKIHVKLFENVKVE